MKVNSKDVSIKIKFHSIFQKFATFAVVIIKLRVLKHCPDNFCAASKLAILNSSVLHQNENNFILKYYEVLLVFYFLSQRIQGFVPTGYFFYKYLNVLVQKFS